MTESLRKYGLALIVVVLVLTISVFGEQSVFASTSSSYEMYGNLDHVNGSESNSYNLCSGFDDISVKSSSSSYNLIPYLRCAQDYYDGDGAYPHQPNICGNGIIEFNEQCDDGNLVSGDGCSATCGIEYSPGGPSGGGAPSYIPPAVCSNGVLESGEDCDDGNLINNDGCDRTCKREIPSDEIPEEEIIEEVVPGICGNKIVETGEDCDDGNLINRDGCNYRCRIEFDICGNKIVEGMEECDDGNQANRDGCSVYCKIEYVRCGNGVLERYEQCDDGNLFSGDGCNSDCRIELPEDYVEMLCGNGVVDEGEECDDGNRKNRDGCNRHCRIEREVELRPAAEEKVPAVPIKEYLPALHFDHCGDGILGATEECDDGNLRDGDGCSQDCTIELPFFEEKDDVVDYLVETLDTLDEAFVEEAEGDQVGAIEVLVNSIEKLEDSMKEQFDEEEYAALEELKERIEELDNFLEERKGEERKEELDALVDALEELQELLEKDLEDELAIVFNALIKKIEEEGEELTVERYFTNDLSTLFFDSFEGGSGDYEVKIRDGRIIEKIEVIPTTEDYFSFQIEEEIPDGVYEIIVSDRKNPEREKHIRLRVEEKLSIEKPVLYEIDGVILDEDDFQAEFAVYEERPILKGRTEGSALVAIYLEQLDQSFVLETDEQNEFQFEYPESLVAGVSETIHIVAHYKNNTISKEQTIQFQFTQLQEAAPMELKEAAPEKLLVQPFSALYWAYMAVLSLIIAFILVITWTVFVKVGEHIASIKTSILYPKSSLGKLIRALFYAFLIFGLIFFFAVHVYSATTTPTILPYEGILRNPSHAAIATAQDFRFSLWSDADYDVPADFDGAGAIPGGAPGYSGYQEVQTITPDANGFFQINIGAVAPIPDFVLATHSYLQVEVKNSGAADTAYELLDIDGTANTTDRQIIGTMPYARNADLLDNADLGTSAGNLVPLGIGDVFPKAVIPGGTDSNDFEIDADDSAAGVIRLSFGSILTGNILSYNPNGVGVGDGWFNFSDDLNVSGNLTVTGSIQSAGGLTITSGTIDLSSASNFRIPENDFTTVPDCYYVGELIYDASTISLKYCTSTGSPGTWTTVSNPDQDFESVFTADGDSALDTTNADFTIDTGTADFIVDSNDWNVDASGNLDAVGISGTGAINFSAASNFRIREDSDPAANAACATLNELIVDTTDNEVQICTGIGGAGAATWVAVSNGDANTLDGFDSLQFLRSDVSDSFGDAGGAQIFTIGDGTNADTLTFSANAIFNTGTGIFQINGTTVNASGTELNQLVGTTNIAESDTFFGASDITGAEAETLSDGSDAAALHIHDSQYYTETELSAITTGNGASLIGVEDASTFFSGADIEAVINELEALLGSTTSTTYNFSEDNVLVDDDAVYAALDRLDLKWGDIASTANAEGASLIAVEDASGFFTGVNIEAVIDELEALLGATTSTSYNFGEDNVLVDNDAVYAALNKLDLKWGDLASIANGEGASLIGVEDAGTYFTNTDVEAVLQEIGSSIGSGAANVETIVYYPEYPDSVIFQDGTNNKGTLLSDYDDTNDEHYYNWTTTQGSTQDLNIVMRFVLPADLASVGDFVFRYRTGTVTEADNDIEVYIYNVTNETTGDPTLCASDTTNGSANVWATETITAASITTGCTGGTALDAGDVVEIQVKFFDNNGAADFADMGYFIFNYTN